MLALEQHVPGKATSPSRAIKTIKIKVFIWGNGTAQGQYADNPANRAAIAQTLQRIEQEWWIDILPPSDPTPYYQNLTGQCADPNLNWYQCNPDTRLRMDFDAQEDIHFIQDPTMWGLTTSNNDRPALNAQADALVPGSNEALKIHFVGGPGCVNLNGGAGEAYTPEYNQVGNTWTTNNGVTSCSHSDAANNWAFDADDIGFYAVHWSHELGHSLGLYHLYSSVFAQEYTAPHRDILSDVFGRYLQDPLPQPWCGLQGQYCILGDGDSDPFANPFDEWTNVFMGANRSGVDAGTAVRFVSPFQMARMHRTLMLSSMSRYAWGYDPAPYRLTSYVELNSLWDFALPQEQKFRMKMFQDLVIPRGAIMVVKCTLEFVQQARLVIEPGGKLIIDGGLIRAAEFSTAQWRGIEVRGDALDEVSGTPGNWFNHDAGVLEMINGGRIEDAEVGVYIGNRDRPEQGGGIFRALYGTTPAKPVIRNCNVGVEFPSDLRSGTSVLDHILFERTTDALPGSTGNVLEAHIKLTDVALQTITDCSFTNDVPGLSSLDRGQGILATNSGVIVWPGCPFGTAANVSCTATNNGAPNVFRGLDHGIDLRSTGPQHAIVIYKNTFEDNVISVYASGTNNVVVHDNSIAMGLTGVEHTGDVDEAFTGFERGIYFTESYAFSIRDNEVFGLPGSKAEAIVIGYSRDWNDAILNNAVRDVEHAYVGEGICADVFNGGHNFIGLHFGCNTNENDRIDFWSRIVTLEQTPLEQTFHTIRGHQGSASAAADNTFDHSSGFGHSDFNVETVFTNINYFQRPDISGANYDPQVFDADRFQVFELTVPNNSPCNSSPPGPLAPVTGVVTTLNERRTAYANTRYLYNGLIDGGNTDEVVQEVMSAWPNEAWELRNYLLGQSPYLSVEALKAAVNKTYFPMAMKAEICIANPDATKQQDFIKWLEYDAVEPMPEYLRDAIHASWDTKTYRTDLEVAMADQHTAMTEAAEILVANYYLESTVNLDDVRWVWQQVRNPAARYAEANTHLAQDNYDAAVAVVQSIPLDQELKTPQVEEQQRMVGYINILKTAHQQGRDKWHLNAGEVAQLEAQRASAYDRSANWISNLLCIGYQICRPPITSADDGTPKAYRRTIDGTSTEDGPLFQTAPNPASEWVTFTYDLKTEPTNAFVEVRDGLGRHVSTLVMTNKQGQLLLDVRGFRAGVYTVLYSLAGNTMQTDKLVVQ